MNLPIFNTRIAHVDLSFRTDRYKYTYLAIPFTTIIFKEYRQKTKVDKIEFLLNCLESSSIIINKRTTDHSTQQDESD